MRHRPIAEPTGPGQESVWGYPRPPRVERSRATVEVVLGGERIASTRRAWRVLETSHPPNYYLPASAFVPGALVPAAGSSFCEWKGVATYWTLRGGDRVAVDAGWSYPDPRPGYESIRDHVAVYAGRVDACTVDGEVVTPQPGGFYGGWITAAVVGPFKGGPGSAGW
jgi:uncharacterized protein (DUF427 family)